MEKAAFDQEVNAKKAEAQLAYELQVCAYRGVPRERCPENIQQIYRRTPMPL